jgi:hypothetical protein
MTFTMIYGRAVAWFEKKVGIPWFYAAETLETHYDLQLHAETDWIAGMSATFSLGC